MYTLLATGFSITKDPTCERKDHHGVYIVFIHVARLMYRISISPRFFPLRNPGLSKEPSGGGIKLDDDT